MKLFWWPPLNVSGGWGVGPQVNKFEQVFSDDHQMSVAGLMSGIWGRGRVEGYPCPEVSWVMVMWGPPNKNDRQTSAKTLPSCNFVCGW